MAFCDITLVARLGKDPEVRVSQNGTAFASYSVALEHKAGDEKVTDWINCKAIGRNAEFAEKYLHRGQEIGINGTLQTDTYESNGQKRTSTYVLVNRHFFVGTKESNSGYPSNSTAMNGESDADGFKGFSDADIPEDLPFV